MISPMTHHEPRARPSSRRRERRAPAVAATLISAIAAFLAPPRAEARPIRVTVLDSDVVTADAVVVATVTRESLLRTVTQPYRVTDDLRLDLRVELALKGPRRGVAILHDRLNPRSPSVPNGYSPVVLRVGQTYLFFLGRVAAGEYRLLAVEDPYVVVVPPADLAALRALPQSGTAHARAIAILRTLAARCQGACHGVLWLLSGSQTFQGQVRKGPLRKPWVADLDRITRGPADENTLIGAYYLLGGLGATQVVPRIVAAVLAAEKPGSKRFPTNLIGWLQGFAPHVQIAALRTILSRSRQSETRRYARERIREAQRQIRQSGGRP